ncbi:MAG: hypothetical protein RIC30_09860 [Marinoscillum sp.]
MIWNKYLCLLVVLYCFARGVYGQVLVKGDSVLTGHKHYIPSLSFEKDSSFFVSFKVFIEGKLTHELHRFDRNMNPINEVIYLDGHLENLNSVGSAYFKDDLIHITQVEEKDSLKFYAQSIDLNNLVKSKNQFFTAFAKKETGRKSEFQTFHISNDTSKLAFIYSVPVSFSENEKIRIVEFNDQFNISRTDDFDLGRSQNVLSILDVDYCNNGDAYVLVKVKSSPGFYFECYRLTLGKEAVLVDRIQKVDNVLMGVVDDQLYLLSSFALHTNSGTRGLLIKSQDLNEPINIESHVINFDIDYFKSHTPEKKHKKLERSISSGVPFAKDKILIYGLYKIGEEFILIGYKFDDNYLRRKIYAYGINMDFEMKWSRSFDGSYPFVMLNTDRSRLNLVYRNFESNLTQVKFDTDGMLSLTKVEKDYMRGLKVCVNNNGVGDEVLLFRSGELKTLSRYQYLFWLYRLNLE